MTLIQIEVGPMQNFNYLVGCPATGAAALVDPAWEVERMLAEAGKAGLRVTDILITHTHPDHVEGLGRAAAATGAAVHVHHLEADSAAARLSGQASPALIQPLSDNDVIEVGEVKLTAMHTPGHTPGATCYLVPGGVMTGDTLFIGRCGRTDFPGSDPRAMYESLRRLASLPEATVVYPGHNYAERPTSTIGQEKAGNVHMAAPDLAEFLRRRMGAKA